MSRVVNFVFDGAIFMGIEDVRTGKPIAVGTIVHLEDGMTAIQVRVMDHHLADNEGNIIAARGAVKVESAPLNAPTRFIQTNPPARDPRRSLP